MMETRPHKGSLRLVASAAAASGIVSGTVFASWSDQPPRDVVTFAKAGAEVWELPRLTKDEEERLLSRYHQIIAGIGTENGEDSVWWYTWSSSRDRFYSRILADMELMARFNKACEQGLPDNLIFLCPDPYVAAALQHISKRKGIIPHLGMQDRLRWMGRRSRMKLAPVVGGTKVCGHAFLCKLSTRKVKVSLERARQAPQRYVLVTWIKGKNLSGIDPPSDTFFGKLPEFLAGDNRAVVVFGGILDGVPPSQPRRTLDSLSPVLTTSEFITNWDLVAAFARGFLSSPGIHQTLKAEGSYMESLVRRDIHANRASIVYGLVFEKALRRLVTEVRPTQIIHICENNPWERACARASAAVNPQAIVTGYMHCAVLLSHTKIVITEQEKKVRPRPGRIICTGPRARDVMVRFGGHSPDEVVAGCALRHEYLMEIPCRDSFRRPVRNILVVLEGLPNTAQLVRFVHAALHREKGYRTVIRPHPAYPFQRTLHDAGLTESGLGNISVSTHGAIMEDFQEADLVVYKGSTSAIEAGYIGIPLVHVKHQNLLTDDPLFEVASLKQVVERPEELVPAIESFSSMDDNEFRQQHSRLRRYIDEYLVMPSPDHLSVFLSSAATGERP